MAQQAAFVTDVAQRYGADFQLTYNGDLALVQDTLDTPAATIQRLERIVLTSPTLQDEDGIAVGRPDDLFDPNFGAGLPSIVGEPITASLVNAMAARILAAIAADPGIATSPTPEVSVTQGAPPQNNALFVRVQCNTVAGATVVIPSLKLNVGGTT